MIYRYTRVSTSAQDFATRVDLLNAARCEGIIHDKLSSLTMERPQSTCASTEAEFRAGERGAQVGEAIQRRETGTNHKTLVAIGGSYNRDTTTITRRTAEARP